MSRVREFCSGKASVRSRATKANTPRGSEERGRSTRRIIGKVRTGVAVRQSGGCAGECRRGGGWAGWLLGRPGLWESDKNYQWVKVARAATAEDQYRQTSAWAKEREREEEKRTALSAP